MFSLRTNPGNDHAGIAIRDGFHSTNLANECRPYASDSYTSRTVRRSMHISRKLTRFRCTNEQSRNRWRDIGGSMRTRSRDDDRCAPATRLPASSFPIITPLNWPCATHYPHFLRGYPGGYQGRKAHGINDFDLSPFSLAVFNAHRVTERDESPRVSNPPQVEPRHPVS